MRCFAGPSIRTLIGVLLVVTWIVVPTGEGAAKTVTLTVESDLWFEGGSTLGDWACREVPVRGTVVLANMPADPDALAGLLEDRPDTTGEPTLRFPVKKIGCEEGERMNNHMRSALQAEKHPAVIFRVGAVRPEGRADTPAGALRANVEGELTVSGTTKSVVIPTTLRLIDGDLRVRGDLELDMTEYGVEPPTLMFGTLSVHRSMIVHADFRLSPSR